MTYRDIEKIEDAAEVTIRCLLKITPVMLEELSKAQYDMPQTQRVLMAIDDTVEVLGDLINLSQNFINHIEKKIKHKST